MKALKAAPPAERQFSQAYESVRRGGRAVEGARLESVYTPKGYRGFESRSLRNLMSTNELINLIFSNSGKNIVNYAQIIDLSVCDVLGLLC